MAKLNGGINLLVLNFLAWTVGIILSVVAIGICWCLCVIQKQDIDYSVNNKKSPR